MDLLINELTQVNIINKGNYILKSGIYSNFYCDFRTLISFPELIGKIYDFIPSSIYNNIDLVCGVFFGGLPLSNYISFNKNISQIFVRDIVKSHGTKKLIEGNYKEGQTVLLIEDVITTGASVYEKVKILKNHNLNVVILCILDRSCLDNTLIPELEELKNNGLLHSIIPIDMIY